MRNALEKGAVHLFDGTIGLLVKESKSLFHDKLHNPSDDATHRAIAQHFRTLAPGDTCPRNKAPVVRLGNIGDCDGAGLSLRSFYVSQEMKSTTAEYKM